MVKIPTCMHAYIHACYPAPGFLRMVGPACPRNERDGDSFHFK